MRHVSSFHRLFFVSSFLFCLFVVLGALFVCFQLQFFNILNEGFLGAVTKRSKQ